MTNKNTHITGEHKVIPSADLAGRLSRLKIEDHSLLQVDLLQCSLCEFVPEPICIEVGQLSPKKIEGKQRKLLLRATLEFILANNERIPPATFIMVDTSPITFGIAPHFRSGLLCFGRRGRSEGGKLFLTTRNPEMKRPPGTLRFTLA